MIQVRDLCKRFDETRAVDGVSFDMKQGEILGFLGPNGAGKTTTMRVITCYLQPTSGTVEVRFSVDAAGATAVKGSSGPELLQAAAEDAVRTWFFRRTTAERVHLVAVFNYGADSASAAVIAEP